MSVSLALAAVLLGAVPSWAAKADGYGSGSGYGSGDGDGDGDGYGYGYGYGDGSGSGYGDGYGDIDGSGSGSGSGYGDIEPLTTIGAWDVVVVSAERITVDCQVYSLADFRPQWMRLARAHGILAEEAASSLATVEAFLATGSDR